MASTAGQLCSRGHASATDDYCSECGAKMPGAPSHSPNPEMSSAPVGTISTCPECGGSHEQGGLTFCEICGYNFVSGARGELPPPSVQEAKQDELQPVADSKTSAQDDRATDQEASHTWQLVITVDPSLNESKDLVAPTAVESYTCVLDAEVHLIGRADETRGIRPEITLRDDDAVSRRHALLQRSKDGVWLLRDIGSANGTRVNGEELTPMVDRELQHGDEITLGHWTRIRVQVL